MSKERLEYLRGEIEAERISMSEIHELQGMADQIDPSDVLLLEWAGVPEFPEPVTYFVGLDSMVSVDDDDGTMDEAQVIEEAHWKLIQLMEESRRNPAFTLDWNVETT